MQIGDKVVVKANHGWGLNRAFRRACTKRRPAVVKRLFKDALLLEVVKGTTVMQEWVNKQEVEALDA